jgi:LytS/YehU family sensor histidine kinase
VAQHLAVHFAAALVIGIVHSILWVTLTVTVLPFDRMTDVPPLKGRIAFVIAETPAEMLIYAAVLGALHVAELVRRHREREALLARARLQALELQLQPHFLFNTLNAVSSLVRTARNDEAVTMIAGLSELLRYTLDHANDPTVTLDEESAILRRYLEIQRTRFPDRLTFAIEVASDVRKAAVPTLILQPLAENAIRHGIATSAGAGEVSVRAFRDNGDLRIEMFNSGSLRDAPDGIGLRNTRERLQRIYGDGHRFDLRGTSGGVVASLSLPFQEQP